MSGRKATSFWLARAAARARAERDHDRDRHMDVLAGILDEVRVLE